MSLSFLPITDSLTSLNQSSPRIVFIKHIKDIYLSQSGTAITNTEREKFIVTLKQYKKRFSTNKEASRKFFVKAGILTQKGKLTAPYKTLCIPQEQV